MLSEKVSWILEYVAFVIYDDWDDVFIKPLVFLYFLIKCSNLVSILLAESHINYPILIIDFDYNIWLHSFSHIALLGAYNVWMLSGTDVFK